MLTYNILTECFSYRQYDYVISIVHLRLKLIK